MPASPQLDPAPGLEVLGYRLVRRLGKGGFGEVWLATGPGGFEVAVKFVQRQTGAERAEQRSLQILRVVRHLHLLTVFAAAEVHDHLVIVMELANGSLLDRLRDCQRQGQAGLPVDELLRYMTHAAEGLDYLNAPRHTVDGKENVSVQHRDIKPHNLLFVGDAIKVGDFGLAKLQESFVITHTGAMTPAYAPPEVLEGRTTGTSDQFSLAATYYHMRTGELLFGSSWQEFAARIRERQEPDLRILPAGEIAVVAKAMAFDPRMRYPNCSQFVQSLRGAITDRSQYNIAAVRPTAEVSIKPHDTDGAYTGTLIGHSGVVTCLIWSPDGRFLVSGSADKTIKVWNADTGQELQTLAGHTDAVTSLAFSPDGKNFASGGADKQIRLWNAATGQGILAMQGHASAIICTGFSPDGKHLVSASTDKTLRLWNTQSGQEIRTLRGNNMRIIGVTFSPDGRQLLSGSWDCTFNVWDVGTGNVVQLYAWPHTGIVLCVAFSSDGKHVVTGSADKTIKIWNIDSKQEIATLVGHLDVVISVAWSRDGSRLVSSGKDKMLILWDAKSGRTLRSYNINAELVPGLALCPDGTRVATGASDGTVRILPLE